MSVVVWFKCNGCDAAAEGTSRLRKEFVSVSGRSYGFGSARWTNTPDDVVPEGWVAADPCTYCCYCPACWQQINRERVVEAP